MKIAICSPVDPDIRIYAKLFVHGDYQKYTLQREGDINRFYFKIYNDSFIDKEIYSLFNRGYSKEQMMDLLSSDEENFMDDELKIGFSKELQKRTSEIVHELIVDQFNFETREFEKLEGE